MIDAGPGNVTETLIETLPASEESVRICRFAGRFS